MKKILYILAMLPVPALWTYMIINLYGFDAYFYLLCLIVVFIGLAALFIWGFFNFID